MRNEEAPIRTNSLICSQNAGFPEQWLCSAMCGEDAYNFANPMMMVSGIASTFREYTVTPDLRYQKLSKFP